tara:strand:- start:3652 stop:4041 length:390 start_codon:yes stop_codon:yes gene_type:complete
MLTKLISKIFKKKLFKCEVVLLKDDFVAEFETNSLKSALDWVLHGIYEARYTTEEDNSKVSKFSATKGVYGRIMPYKMISLSEKNLTLFGYQKPKPNDHVFMTDTMIHVPDNILKQVKSEAIEEYFISK